jgi:Transposase, Mutator family
MARRKAPHIPDALLDQLLAGADPKTAFESEGLLDALKKALAERALNAEMDHHLAGEDAGNTRNGYGRKTVTAETGRIELAIPRDRQATFDPQLIARHDFHPRLSPRRLLPGVSQTEGATACAYQEGHCVHSGPTGSSGEIGSPWLLSSSAMKARRLSVRAPVYNRSRKGRRP